MTRENMTQMLSEAICVSPEEARSALEASEWKLLEAARRLQQARERAKSAALAQALRRQRERKPADAVRRVIARFSRRRIEARIEEKAQAVSARTLAPLMLMPGVYCRCW